MSIEAMKQALEALELHAKQYPHMQKGYTVDAITSLHQAIAEAETQEPVAYVETKEVHGQMCSFIYRADSTSLLPDGSKLYTHPQPKQEPDDLTIAYMSGFHDGKKKREWVGFTPEEIEQGCKESWVTLQAWQSAVWWAEEKLKEKNT